MGKKDFLQLQALSKWFYDIGIGRSQIRLVSRSFLSAFKRRAPFWRQGDGLILVWRKNEGDAQTPQFSGTDQDLKKMEIWISTPLNDNRMHQVLNDETETRMIEIEQSGNSFSI